MKDAAALACISHSRIDALQRRPPGRLYWHSLPGAQSKGPRRQGKASFV